MSGYPGLETSLDGAPYLDPQSARETLTAIHQNGARLMVVLTEEAELPDGAFDMVRGVANQLGIKMVFLSIPDFGVPDATFMTQWEQLRQDRLDTPETARCIAFACQFGAGRSGLMAALVQIQAGLDPVAAIPLIRSHFSQAIESEAQENWLNARIPGQ